tara:strand:- start:83 stop:328 length:246 start_codon:yes stop_codon:yes gene_type:complete
MKFLDFSFLKDGSESADDAVKSQVKRRKGKRLNYTRPTKKVSEEPTPVSTPMEEPKKEMTRNDRMKNISRNRKSLRERYGR